MAGPVTDAHRIMFRDNFIMASQEASKKFDEAFLADNSGLSGKQVQIANVMGKIEAQKNTPEGAASPDLKPSHEPVWVKPDKYRVGQLFSKEDVVKGLTVPNSAYINVGVAGLVRARNKHFADALLAPRLIGNEVPVSTPWAGTTVGVNVGGANTGMNVLKFQTALKVLEDADVDLDNEKIFCVLDPQEILDLYQAIQITSKDYRNRAVLEEKRVLEFMGVKIIPYRRLADHAANNSTAVMFCGSTMMGGDFMPLEVNSGPDAGVDFRERYSAEMWIGATRIEDAKVVKIITYFA